MTRVFVSYSRNNLDAVTQLIDDLNAAGVSTWHDQTLTGGQRWWDNILANIRECDVFVFALSPESWESEACKSELGYVAQLGKPILPVLVADGININLLPHPLNEIQVTDCRSGDKASVFALVKSIYAAPAAQPLPQPLPAVPRVPVSYLSNLNDRIESTEPLTSQEQITLLFELEEELRQGRSPTEVHALLLRLKRRDDLLAKVATKIDAALKALDDKGPTAPRDDAAREHTVIPPRNKSAKANRVSEPKSCPKCRTELDAGSRFCRNCGAALAEPGTIIVSPPVEAPSEQNGPAVEGSVTRRYLCPPEDNPRLVADVKRWLESQDFDTQQMRTDSEGVLFQIKKRGGWRDFVGMATSLNVAFHQSGDTLTVQIGAGKWIDKAAVGTVSLFILWPLAVTAGFGAWEQMKMPDKVFDFIGTRLTYK